MNSYKFRNKFNRAVTRTVQAASLGDASLKLPKSYEWDLLTITKLKKDEKSI